MLLSHDKQKRLVSTFYWPVLFICLCLLSGGRVSAQDWLYTTQAGDTLWDLSERYLIKRSFWRRVQQLNNVADPYQMPTGLQLRIPASWLKMDAVKAQAIAVQGQVELMTTDGVSKPLLVGAQLNTGDIIRTAADSNVFVQFIDGARILVEANSEVSLLRVRGFSPLGVGDNRLDLRKGSVEAALPEGKKQAGSRFQIRTRAATLAVRGTRFRVRAPVDVPISAAEVLRGVMAANAAGQTRSVEAGFGILIEQGQAPQRPQRLLPSPDLTNLPTRVERVPIVFNLKPQPDALAYRAQIAADLRFNALLANVVAPSTQIIGPDLPDGDYVARIRGINQQGLEGFDAQHRFTLNARPEPPLMIAPALDAIMRQPNPQFQWTAVEGVSGYRLQIAASVDFAAPIVDLVDYSQPQFTPEQALSDGNYFWRISSIVDDSDVGPFSDPIRFTVRLAPASPELEPPELAADTIVFRWRGGIPGQRYQFQLARDYWFEDLMVDEQLSESTISIPRPRSERYYLRIRTIDIDGYKGPFGPRQSLVVPLTDYWQSMVLPTLFLLLL